MAAAPATFPAGGATTRKLERWNAKDIKDDPNEVKIKDKVIKEGATMAELGSASSVVGDREDGSHLLTAQR
jgi:hypothetical protein